jgi:cellobiose phosphorylase
VTLYVDWVLGENPTRSHLHLVTHQDAETQAVFARNAFRQEFSHRVAFLDLHPGEKKTVSADRTEFLGRNGRLSHPAAMRRASLSGRSGPALDPCGAIQVTLELKALEKRTVVGLLGDAVDAETARDLVKKYRDSTYVNEAMQRVVSFWDRLLGTLPSRRPIARST